MAGNERPPRPGEWSPLPIEPLERNTPLYRTHRLEHDTLYFSVADKANRYDDSGGRFGVCYTSLSAEGAFAEAFLRRPAGGFVDEATLDTRALSVLNASRALRLVPFYGAGLSGLGMTAAVTAGPVATAQAWSAACYFHGDQPDGIIYRVRHDNDQFGIALFDRCEAVMTTVQTECWRHAPALQAMCERYNLVL